MTLRTVIHPALPRNFAKEFGNLSLLKMLILNYARFPKVHLPMVVHPICRFTAKVNGWCSHARWPERVQIRKGFKKVSFPVSAGYAARR